MRFNETDIRALPKDEYGYRQAGELLPCGAFSVRYWEDQNGKAYAQCEAGCTFVQRSNVVAIWCVLNDKEKAGQGL